MKNEEILEIAKECEAYRYINRAAKDEPTHTSTIEKLTRFAKEIERRTIERCAFTVERFISGDGIVEDVWIHDIEEAIRGLNVT